MHLKLQSRLFSRLLYSN